MEEQLKLPFEGEGTLTGKVIRRYLRQKIWIHPYESGKEYFFHSIRCNGRFSDNLLVT